MYICILIVCWFQDNPSLLESGNSALAPPPPKKKCSALFLEKVSPSGESFSATALHFVPAIYTMHQQMYLFLYLFCIT